MGRNVLAIQVKQFTGASYFDCGVLCTTDPTSISEELRMKSEELFDGAICNLAGQRLSKPQRGLNIINGKKILY